MVELVLINELQVPLMLTNVSLMWQLFPVALTEVAGAAETPAAVAHEVCPILLLESLETVYGFYCNVDIVFAFLYLY